MLITQVARDTHEEVVQGWVALDAFLAAHPDAAAKVEPSIRVFRDHWHEVDKGILSDSDAICGALTDLETAETTAAGIGYPKPHRPPRTESCTVQVAQETAIAGSGIVPGGPAIVATALYCEQHPQEDICKLTAATGNPTWCERTGAPNFVCSDWFPYALGGAVLGVVGLVGYAAYRAARVAAPIALAAYAPELVPHYQAWESAKTPEERQRAARAGLEAIR